MSNSQASKGSLKFKSDMHEQGSSSNELAEHLSRPEQEKQSKPEKQISPHLSFIHESNEKSIREKEKLKQKQMRDVTQFANAWKSESGLGILIIEKISQLIHNYFKILPELAKREEQNEILIVYNKGLLEILDKFESHERKITNKLRSMQEFNVKIMKQLCHIKNKPFKPPEIKNQESMFAKFSLSNFTLHKHQKIEEKVDEKYTKTLFQIFQKYLLRKNMDYLPLVEAKIEEFKQAGKGQKQRQLLERDQLENLIELRNKIVVFEEGLKNVVEEQIFNLYELKATIKQQLKFFGLYPREVSWKEKEKQEEGEFNFVSQVIKISASLNKMNQNELQNCLKMEKETRKRLRKQRLKEQEKFLRACQSIQSENIELSHDIQKFKQRISSLENQVNVMKAEYDYKKMKIKPHPSNKSSVIQQSIMIDDETNMKTSNKKLVKQTHRAMNYDFKKIKEDNQRLQEIVAEYKGKEMSRMLILPKIREKAEKMQLNLDPSWEQIKIIQFLLSQFGQISKQKKLPSSFDPHRDDELVSPNFDERSFYGFEVNPVQYLNTIPEKSEFDPDILENRNKQLQKQVSQLRKKNEEYKNMVTGKSQDLRRVLEEHESTLKQKNGKINQLVKEYERFQTQIKELKLQNHLLWIKWEYSQKLSDNLTKIIQQFHSYDVGQADLQSLKGLVTKLENLNEQFRVEIKKQEENYEQKRQISLLRAGQDEISSRHGTSNDQSIASLWTKNREKRQSDIFSIQSKEDEQKPRPKLRNLKSLNSNGESNNNFIEQELEKELSLKKLLHKKYQSSHQKSKQKAKDKNKQKSKAMQISGKKEPATSKKNESQHSKDADKQLSIKKMDQFSIDSGENNIDKKKGEKQSATQIGLLKIGQTEVRQKIARTEQSGSDEKGVKSQSYQNKNSNSNSNSNSNNNPINKEEQNGKELSNILSYLDNNQNDFIDSISERPKGISKQQFKQEQKNRQSQDKKNKVSMNDALKGSGNLEIFSSRRNKFNLRQDSKKSKDEGIGFGQKQDRKREDRYNESQNSQRKQKEQVRDQYQELKKSGLLKTVIRRIDNLSQGEQSIMIDTSRIKKSFRMEHQQDEESNIISEPIIRINNVTRRSESQQLAGKQEERVENKSFSHVSSQMNERSISLDYSRDGSLGKQKSSIINMNNQLTQPAKNINELLKNSATYERIAQITVEEHEKIMARIQKLGDMDDVLDFIELYNRYKQVLICLDEAEAHIRTIYLRYQKFVEDLTKKQQTPGYSVEEQLFYLKELVEEQRNQIQNFDKKCNQNMKVNIQKSDIMIRQHLKMMRNQAKLEKSKELSGKRLFL